ncbi:hypothetical protein [Streptacidiphilus sp. PAMC 29251]
MPLLDSRDGARWRDFLTPAAGLWLVAATMAVGAGHGGWGRWCVGAEPDRAARLAGTVALALAAAVALGLIGRTLERLLTDLWLGRRPRGLLRPLLARRQVRWDRADEAAATAASREERYRQAGIRNRIALARPEAATWMGDRLLALETRVFHEYGLDLPSTWPRLWLVVPETCRAELRADRAAWREAVRWGVWALLYGVLTLVWWPLLLLAVVTMVGAVRSARNSLESLTDHAEAAVDLYAPDLGRALGLEVRDGQVDLTLAQLINSRLRKSV